MSIDGGLRPLFHQRLREGFHWQAIETGGTGLGIPDSNFCGTDTRTGVSVDGWVEFKQTSGWAVGLSPEQVGWHRVRCARGGRTFVAVRRWHDGGPRKGPPVDELWLYEGRWAGRLAREGLGQDVPLLGWWPSGPSAWRWDSVRELLLGSPAEDHRTE